MKIDKKQFKDVKGRYIVQGLFLEDSYNTDLSVYTFDGGDKLYKGSLYPSLKRLYLEQGDVTEYEFAKKYCYDWPHWERLCKNAVVGRHIATWREELYLSLRSEGIATLIDLAVNDKSYQAAKYLADEGWVKNKRGRPSNEEVEGEVARRAKIEKEFADDFQLLELHRDNKNG